MKKNISRNNLPKQIGNLTELQCIAAFYKLGYTVSIPYGENNRYDFIADINTKLIRVQVKSSKTRDGGKSYIFSCRSSRTNGKSSINIKYSKFEIDYFATFINNNCYLAPVEECSSSKTLRFDRCDNNQQSCINFHENYLLETQLNLIINKN